MPKNVLKIIGFFVVGMVGGIFADQIIWPYFVERPLFYQYGLENPPIYVTEIKQITVEENKAITDAVEQVEKTVVGVKSVTKTGVILEGSGLIITSDGLMVTLAELLPLTANSSFFVDGKAKAFQVLKRDAVMNLALVKLSETNLKTSGFADLGKTKAGERVFLVGAFFNENGVVKIVNEGTIRLFDANLIRTNILERRQLAGSPLFNIKGEVVGLNVVDEAGKISAIPVLKIKELAGF